MLSRSLFLSAVAASFSLTNGDPLDPAICYSYGVDFVDEGEYFINAESTEQFSAVSYFKGCKEDIADVLLVAPEDGEYMCDQIPTTPDDENRVSTCPIQKNQMTTGSWLLLILGNNGENGQPFAWQRDLYLTVGQQITSTYTPTVTYDIVETPIVTQTTTTTATDVLTTGPFSTVTVPSGTAKKIKTVTPHRVTTTTTSTRTKTKLSVTLGFGVTTKTVEATCTTPGHQGKPDKPCKYRPTLLTPAALATPTTIPMFHRWIKKGDRAVDVEWARARIEAAKERRAGRLGRRAPDVPTTTLTVDTPITKTATMTAAATTEIEVVEIEETITSTIPAPTVLKGLLTLTTTLPTPTRTKTKKAKTTTTKVITIGATITKTKTVTPEAAVTACKKNGGHFWLH